MDTQGRRAQSGMALRTIGDDNQAAAVGCVEAGTESGGEKAIAVEEKRLRELKAAGIPVPEVLAHQADALSSVI